MKDAQEYLDEVEDKIVFDSAKLEQNFSLGRALIMAVIMWVIYKLIWGRRQHGRA